MEDVLRESLASKLPLPPFPLSPFTALVPFARREWASAFSPHPTLFFGLPVAYDAEAVSTTTGGGMDDEDALEEELIKAAARASEAEALEAVRLASEAEWLAQVRIS